MSLIEIAAQLLIEGTEYVCDSLIYRFGLRLYQSFGGRAPDQFKTMIWALGITGWITIAVSAVVFVLWLLGRTNP